MEGNKRAPFGTAIHFMFLHCSYFLPDVYIYVFSIQIKVKIKEVDVGQSYGTTDRWAQSSG
jgi:hypothetical protein